MVVALQAGTELTLLMAGCRLHSDSQLGFIVWDEAHRQAAVFELFQKPRTDRVPAPRPET